MSVSDLWWWVILPYTAIAIFVVGHVWRWRYDQFGWTSRSTELQEKRLLKWGGPLFHYGAFLAIGGHAIGILVPESVTKALGIPESIYYLFSAIGGTIATAGLVLGIVALATRRISVARVRATTSPVDWVVLILLAIVIVLGIILTEANLAGPGYDYRKTVSPWFRSIFYGRPDIAAISRAPLIYQIHAIAAWVIIAVWPFTRLVHAWSYPLWYLWRPYIVYRRRAPDRPTEPGTSSRWWQHIGARY